MYFKKGYLINRLMGTNPNLIEIDIIDCKKKFYDLKDRWNSLLWTCSDPSITQTWEWLYTWWDIYGDERELKILIGYQNNEIVGIAPFAMLKKPTKYFNTISFKTLRFLCTGPIKYRNVASEYQNIIIKKGQEQFFINGLLKYLLIKNDWEAIILENISSESIIPEILESVAFKMNLLFSITSSEPSVIIKLPNNWDKYLQSISSGLRYKINRGRKEFKRLNGEYHLISSEKELSQGFKDLENLHQKRWAAKGKVGAFSCARWKEFHKKLMPLLSQNGWLKLSFLTINTEAVAANYNFIFDKNFIIFNQEWFPMKIII